MISLSIGVVSLAIWIYLRWGRGSFWQVHPEAPAPSATPARIAAIIPARNEAAVVGRAVGSLLQQQGAAFLHVFLVDDHSQDATAEAAQSSARKAGAPDRLTILSAPPLPAGWSGKLWAVAAGVRAALPTQPDYLLLTDADIVHDSGNVAQLVARAEEGPYDLVSLMVKLRCESQAEKLLIPAFVFFFFKLYPPSWIAKRSQSTAGAAGGCILLRPAALAQIGGIEAIRHELIDDCALARQVKRYGPVWLGLTNDAHSIRPYGSFGEIGRMIARTAFTQLHHSVLLLAGSVLGLSLTYLVPVLLVLSGQPVAMALGAAASALMALTFLPLVRFYGLAWWWALLLPVTATFYLGATLWSAAQFWSGQGGQWKGRVQDHG